MNQRERILANLWCNHGCPEKMTIQVSKTGETITLINGLPQNPIATKTIDKPCIVCERLLPLGRTRFCSAKCSKEFHHSLEKQRSRQRAEEAIAILKKAG